MKDLIKLAKTASITNSPRRERIIENAEQQRIKLDTVKIDSKNEDIKKNRTAIKNAVIQHIENFDHKRQQDGIEDRDLSYEVTHATQNLRLLDLDTKTMQYVIKRDINLIDAVNKSREYKKRLRHFLTACAYNDAKKLDKSLALLQIHMKQTQCKTLNITEIQCIMQHSTTTQATYFKNFASTIGVVNAQRSNSVAMEVNVDSEIYQDFIKL